MKYKRLGDYIKQINIRNKDLKVETLLGVTMYKSFIPSVANITGVDMSVYKIIKKNQLACKLMSVGRDAKIPVSILKDIDIAIVSSAYYVFEPKDTNILNPDYLMMWLSRSETDRWVGYISGGDVRGGISWDVFCDLDIVIPSISKQREIVKEYNTVVNRISLNENLNQKLEETAQALYKHWFVDFEFPFDFSKSTPNENGKPYKSSGGEMVYNEELDKEVPVGWFLSNLSSIANISAGGDKPKKYSTNKKKALQIPVVSNSTANEGVFGYTDIASIYKKSITISARGAIIGYTVLRLNPFFPIVRLIVATPINDVNLLYLYFTIMNFRFDNQTSSAQGQLTIPDISSYLILIPVERVTNAFSQITHLLIDEIENRKNSNQKLKELESLLLAKMTTVETEKV